MINSQIHALRPHCPFQRHHIAPLLVHPGKIVSGHVDERIMGSKHDMLCCHCAAGCFHPPAIHLQHLCLLVHFHFLCHSRQKLQWMELCLMFKPCHACHRKGKFTFCSKGCLYTQRFRCLCLPLQKFCLNLGIKICRTPTETTVNPLILNQSFIFRDGSFVCTGIMLRHLMTKCPDEPAINLIMLGCDFRCGILCLPAANPVCLQHHCPDALLL